MKKRGRFTRSWALHSLVALIALTFAGCGGSSSDSSTPPAQPTLKAMCTVNSASLNATLDIQCYAIWSDDSAFSGTFALTAPADADFPGSNATIAIDNTGLVTSSIALALGDEGTKTLTFTAIADNGTEATVTNMFDVDTRMVTMMVDSNLPTLFPKSQADTISADCGIGFIQANADSLDYTFIISDVTCVAATVENFSQAEQDKLMVYLPMGENFSVFFDAAAATSVTFNWTAGQPLPSGPALTSAALATVDADFAITFTDAGGWAAAITNVSVDGTDLAAADFTVDGLAGTLTFHPTNPTPNTLLTTTGTKIVTVFSAGFAPNSVSQIIGAGLPFVANATAVIDLALAEGFLSTVTVTARDQFGNVVANAIDPLFVVDTTTVNNGVGESYFVNGIEVIGGNNLLDSPLTSLNGIASLTIDVPAAIDPGDSITVEVQDAGDNVTPIGTSFTITGAPALTAALNATVDADIIITFTDANGWAAAANVSDSVSVDGIALLPLDFTLAAGTLTLHPANENLQIVTSDNTIPKVVTVSAPGFTVATVDQIIGHGAVDATRSRVRTANLGLGETTVVTVEAADQFNNSATTAAHVFVVDATITNAIGLAEIYTIAGVTGSASFTGEQLTATDLVNGETTFIVMIPAVVDADDGVSIQVRLIDQGPTVDGSINFFN